MFQTLGTELDVKKLKTFFGPDGLNFEIYDPRNYEQDDLTKSQVDVALEDIQHKLNEKENKRYYCFVCVILSHGDEVHVLLYSKFILMCFFWIFTSHPKL